MVNANQHNLSRSRAGMRLMAQMLFYNKGDFERLRGYIAEQYSETALEAIPARTRLAELKAIYRISGRMKVEQVVASSDYQILVALSAEHNGDVYLANVAVDEEHPHKVLVYALGKMDKVEE